MTASPPRRLHVRAHLQLRTYRRHPDNLRALVQAALSAEPASRHSTQQAAAAVQKASDGRPDNLHASPLPGLAGFFLVDSRWLLQSQRSLELGSGVEKWDSNVRQFRGSDGRFVGK